MASKGFIDTFGAGEIDQVARTKAISECSASVHGAQSGPGCDV